MNKNDFEAFSQVVVGLAELKGKQLSSAGIKLYWAAMKSWSIDDFRSAAVVLISRCEFMPTPKDFEDLRKSMLPSADDAWTRVLQHCKGKYRGGDLLDNGGPIDQAVQSIGGYDSIAHYKLDYLWVLQRRFRERYAQIYEGIEARQALPDIETPELPALVDERQS